MAQAVEDWLAYGLGHQSDATVSKYRILCATHIVLKLGARKLRDLTAREVEAWLAGLTPTLSTETLSTDAAPDARLSKPSCSSSDGARPGEAERGRARRGSDRS